jgi:hypothetical protein
LAGDFADLALALARNLVELLLALDRVFAARLLVLERGVELLALECFCPVFRAANGLLSAMSRSPPRCGIFHSDLPAVNAPHAAWERCFGIR